MNKPPESTPHSDINGVHEDERSNVDTAIDADQDNKDLKRAAEQSVGRPPSSEDQESLDDRAR